jgi:hypothetical protein
MPRVQVRVRAEPRLDAAEIGRLHTGELVAALSPPTTMTDDGGNDVEWVLVRLDSGDKGWTALTWRETRPAGKGVRDHMMLRPSQRT